MRYMWLRAGVPCHEPRRPRKRSRTPASKKTVKSQSEGALCLPLPHPSIFLKMAVLKAVVVMVVALMNMASPASAFRPAYGDFRELVEKETKPAHEKARCALRCLSKTRTHLVRAFAYFMDLPAPAHAQMGPCACPGSLCLSGRDGGDGRFSLERKSAAAYRTIDPTFWRSSGGSSLVER